MLNTGGKPERTDPREVARLRMQSQLIVPSGAASEVEIVERLLAVQAQDLAAAKWAVGARMDGSTLTQVDAAINSGAIVRSWPMRGTLHFVLGGDLGWMQQLTTDRLLKQSATRHAQLGLDAAIFAHAQTLAESALTGGRSLSRDEFQALLEQNGIATQDGRGYHIIWRLAQTGIVCWGPTDGTVQRLVLLDGWVQHPRRLDRDEALGEFFLRYVIGHGPAKLQDFVWWSKLTVAEARIGLAVARERLSHRTIGDVQYWLSPTQEITTPDAATRRRFATSAQLLPAFDEYFLGYRDRERSAALEHHARIVPGKNGVFQPIIVVGGRVVGIWKRRNQGGKIDLALEPFEPISQAQHAAIRVQARRYARFLDLMPGEITTNFPEDKRAGLA